MPREENVPQIYLKTNDVMSTFGAVCEYYGIANVHDRLFEDLLQPGVLCDKRIHLFQPSHYCFSTYPWVNQQRTS